MTENALVVQDDVALEAYGDIAKVREMTRRLMAMLPSAKDLGPAGAGALAQASLAMGLNPFIGELWAIPQRGGTYAIMVGIKGLRSKAHQQARADGGMYSVHIRSVREEEIEGLQINKGDIVRACDICVSGARSQAHYDLTGKLPIYTGIGVYRSGESTKMNPLQVARKRAEAEALKQAFDVPLSFVYGGASDDLPEAPLERYEERGGRLVNGNANEAIDELYGDFVGPTGDSFLNGDFHGAPMDADAYEDLKEDKAPDPGHAADIAEAQREIEDLEEPPTPSTVDLDYVPGWIDTDQPRQWGKLYFEAREHLGYKADKHVKRSLANAYGVDEFDEQAAFEGGGYRAAWHLLQEHQRSKQKEKA